MNPLTNVKNLNKVNERELNYGIAGDDRRSWHAKYRDSAWIFVGGLPYDLSEGDLISVFSQYGEIVNINLIRDKKTGKSRGFCFVCYEDQRSTVLAVDNFNGTKVLNRTLRVDHVENYRVPKDRDDLDDETRRLFFEGCAPEVNVEPAKKEIDIDDVETKPKMEPSESKKRHKEKRRSVERERETARSDKQDRERNCPDKRREKDEKRSEKRKSERRERDRSSSPERRKKDRSSSPDRREKERKERRSEKRRDRSSSPERSSKKRKHEEEKRDKKKHRSK